MKKTIYTLIFALYLITNTNTMSAQDTIPGKTAKQVAEAASQADQVHARKIKKKQLHASPEVIAYHDSISIRAKKSPPVKNRNLKKIN